MGIGNMIVRTFSGIKTSIVPRMLDQRQGGVVLTTPLVSLFYGYEGSRRPGMTSRYIIPFIKNWIIV